MRASMHALQKRGTGMMELARLHHEVVFGRSGGRTIWQPRIGCWYNDKIFAGEPLPGPYDR